MDLLSIYLWGGGLVALLMIFIWLLSLFLKNSSIVDIFWGPGFVLLAWFYFSQTPDGDFLRKTLTVGLVTIWGLRLAIYIFLRNFGKPEDFRYRKWREEAGEKWALLSLFKVFFVQGLIMWIISIPLLAAQFQREHLPGWLEILAVVFWLIGFVFEAGGDWQMKQFKADPANQGQVMNRGLWRYTRHPNYFGDAAQWWAFYLLALAAGGWWSFYSPLLMTFLLLRVSGVSLLEKTLKETRSGYKEYIQNTSAFVPWFPKNNQKVEEKE
ncbi:MAG: DUF1295 domain-containing protein [Anaerolineae bacterium]|nr:DUF1295 domain-containing protein [Anaerolineae bacterium]